MTNTSEWGVSSRGPRLYEREEKQTVWCVPRSAPPSQRATRQRRGRRLAETRRRTIVLAAELYLPLARHRSVPWFTHLELREPLGARRGRAVPDSVIAAAVVRVQPRRDAERGADAEGSVEENYRAVEQLAAYLRENCY